LFSVDNNVKLQHSIETNTLNSNNSWISTNSNFYKNDISNFNVNTFISNLKSAWAKWALTMALRWTEMLFKNNNLTIKIKNQISRKSIENTESITLIREILSNMGYQEAEVNII
jgi:hypothetical protein